MQPLRILGLLLVAAVTRPAPATDTVVVEVMEGAVLHWDPDLPEIREGDGYVVRHRGQTAERTLALPAPPADQRDARRIIATVRVEPVFSVVDGRPRPNDPWTRLGTLCVVSGAEPGDTGAGAPVETELLRFATGYGAPGTFERDVTPLAPLLAGTTTLRAFVSTYSEAPGWRVSVTLRYTPDGVGQRRPVFARHLFTAPHVTAAAPRRSATVEVPDGLALPRIQITSTGHATDGTAENEFLSCTHVLRVDGREIARWRPWVEGGGPLRPLNPWAGRRTVDGREVRSSDFDRSGWMPGTAVEPLVIPAPELTPGRHRVELEVIGIRPASPAGEDGTRHHGYWVVGAVVVADEPWPDPAAGESGPAGAGDQP